MTDYKYATEWLSYVSKSPPEEHGGFDPKTIEGATVALIEMRQLKRENILVRRWLKMFLEMCDGEKAWEEVMREARLKIPGLFAGGKKGK